jgi:hypothetical protein
MKRTPVDPRNSSFGEHKKEKKKKEKERKEKKEKKRMVLRPGDEIRNKRDDVLATEGKLSKDAGGVILELDIDDREYTYRLDVLSDGGGTT